MSAGAQTNVEVVWKGSDALRPFLVPIDSLEPFPGNPRRGDVALLRASLRRFGQVKALLVDGKRIVAHHHVRLAAKEEGWTHVAVLENRFASEDEARAYLHADNRTSDVATYDDDLLLEQLRQVEDLEGTGYDPLFVEALERDLARDREQAEAEAGRGHAGDAIPPAPKVPTSKRGEVYELGPHRLMCGDSTNPDDVRTLLGDVALPLVFTSPPYGVGLEYDEYEDTMENLRAVLRALAGTWKEHVPEGGYLVTNFGDNYAARELLGESEPCEYPMALEYWPVFRDEGWILNTRRIFKKIPTWARDPWTFESNRAAFDWEHLWTWKRPGKGLNQRREPSFLGVWDIGQWTAGSSSETTKKDVFPAAFPITLALWTLRVYTNRGDAVADPCAGSGTTLIAAQVTGRRCFAMELDPASCDVIRQRYKEFVELEENLAWSTRQVAGTG